MSKEGLARIEHNLGVALPQDYRDLMLSRAAELKALRFDSNGETLGWFDETLFLESDMVIQVNLIERKPDSGTGYAFPNWWETFFLIGTNGAGDYYCLRVDGQPGVWMIGSDCGETPCKVYPALRRFVEDEVRNYEEETRVVVPLPDWKILLIGIMADVVFVAVVLAPSGPITTRRVLNSAALLFTATLVAMPPFRRMFLQLGYILAGLLVAIIVGSLAGLIGMGIGWLATHFQDQPFSWHVALQGALVGIFLAAWYEVLRTRLYMREKRAGAIEVHAKFLRFLLFPTVVTTACAVAMGPLGLLVVSALDILWLAHSASRDHRAQMAEVPIEKAADNCET